MKSPKSRPGSRKEGRPSKYVPSVHDTTVEVLATLGATDCEIAKALGVSRSTLDRWKNNHPEFQDTLKRAKAIADSQVEKALFQRAVGYSHPDVHVSNYQGKITLTKITKAYPPDTTAMIFWLKNRKPSEWRDRVDADVQVTGGGTTLESILQDIRGMNSAGQPPARTSGVTTR